MPKDPTKNVDRYKIRGGMLNEFELNQNQEAYEQQKSEGGGNLIPGTPPEAAKKASKSTKATKTATPSKSKKAASKKTTKSKKATKTTPTRGASAKKLAARKAAKKK